MPLPWREAYRKTQSNLAKDELYDAVQETEELIFLRMEELHSSPSQDRSEVNEMLDAMQSIRRIQVRVLGFPEFFSDDSDSKRGEPGEDRKSS